MIGNHHHIEPIAPLRLTESEDALRADLAGLPNNGMELAGRYLASLYHAKHPRKDPGNVIAAVCDVLERTVDPEVPDFWMDAEVIAALAPRRTLFMLQRQDMVAVINAIDHARDLGMPWYTPSPCSRYREEYEMIVAADDQMDCPPHDLDTIKGWKKDICLATKREWIIAKKA
jgi:hypothetical protein